MQTKKEISNRYAHQMEYLVEVIQKLSLVKNMNDLVEIVRHAARELTGADGATFILKDGERCYYVDEDAISPLWKGGRFPLDNCVSGWAMLHRESLYIEDIYADERVPIDLYRPTFVKSLAMIPIRIENPLGAIGNYWATKHEINFDELKLLEMLANSTSIAMENIRLYEDLQRQLESRDEFLTIAAHELRTPITPLAIRIQLLQKILKEKDLEEIATQERIKNFVDISSRQVSDVIRLLDNFLDVSRMQVGKFEVHPEASVSLDEILNKILEQYRSLNVTIRDQIQSGVVGNWDRIRLQQLFHNLVSNAVRYGKGSPIEVEMKLVSDDRVRVSVLDHGEGISKDEQERIFSRFERGKRSVNYAGMGLGLYVSRQIVNAHQGSIWIEGDVGLGSCFVVELPLKSSSGV